MSGFKRGIPHKEKRFTIILFVLFEGFRYFFGGNAYLDVFFMSRHLVYVIPNEIIGTGKVKDFAIVWSFRFIRESKYLRLMHFQQVIAFS